MDLKKGDFVYDGQGRGCISEITKNEVGITWYYYKVPPLQETYSREYVEELLNSKHLQINKWRNK